MRADELVLRTPVAGHLPFYLLILGLPQFTGFMGDNDVFSPALRVLCLAMGLFPAVVMIGQSRTPPRFSPRGLVVAAHPAGYRYHPTIPWDAVGRIWTNGPSIGVRLRDPDAVAGSDLAFRRRMHRSRSRRGADLLLPLPAETRNRPLVADAVTRFSGGRLRLERAYVDPVPGSYDVVIGDNRAFLFLLLIGMPTLVPWTFVYAGDASPVALAVAVLIAVPAVLLGLRVAGPLAAPNIIAPSGLRLRVAHPLAYDLTVPWPRVARIWHSRHGRSPAVLVLLDNPDAIAGGNERLRARMRRNRARTGADVIIRTAGSNMDEAYLATAVAHRSGGTRELEHVA
ncbi:MULTISPECIES: hypothetical protein [Catenuloplanes]|uniref:Uncharacterized protein n=1 Tax=Catenuloplanes niger TaxID=587534 RepID=A0AAE4CWG2_9ACTN|nr:hypothetical protein [Catenuloplanes niger]MDR7325468.1 hypothetical protein [Catenuloplanes niger]